MSSLYDEYLRQHKENVKKGFDWIKEHYPEIIPPNVDMEWQIGMAHDESKSKPDEYNAYDAHFYGNNKSYEVEEAYKYAWLTHIHRNPHHWQYWILNNDDPNEGEIILEMPFNYVLEMICDWWSFSWKVGDLTEIFKWWDEHQNYIKLNPATRNIVVGMLDLIHTKLEEKIDE